MGAVCADQKVKEERIIQCRVFSRLMQEVEQERILRKEKDLLKKKINAIWNGHSVLRYFNVSGPKIEKIVKAGQDYVIRRFNEGAKDVSEDEVLTFVKSAHL